LNKQCAIVPNLRPLKRDKNVQVIGFGTFLVKTRKARNPRTGEVIKIKASKTVGFRVGKKLKGTI